MLELHLPPGQSPPVTRWVVVWGECLENETYCRDQAQATAYAAARRGQVVVMCATTPWPSRGGTSSSDEVACCAENGSTTSTSGGTLQATSSTICVQI